MNHKILISIVLSSLLSVAYAAGNPTAPHPSPLSVNVMPQGKLNSSVPYQNCFSNSIWIVPPNTLLAYTYDNATFTPVTDQTVWVFSNYNQGYFFGQSYTAIDLSTLSQKYLIGSVASDGQVYITFYSGTSASTDLVSGIGTLNVQSTGQCYFTMQMNSGQNGVSGLTHWSYMIPITPSDSYYNNLPGTNMSLPDFLAQF